MIIVDSSPYLFPVFGHSFLGDVLLVRPSDLRCDVLAAPRLPFPLSALFSLLLYLSYPQAVYPRIPYCNVFRMKLNLAFFGSYRIPFALPALSPEALKFFFRVEFLCRQMRCRFRR